MNIECPHTPLGFCQPCVKAFIMDAYEDAAKIAETWKGVSNPKDIFRCSLDIAEHIRLRAGELK